MPVNQYTPLGQLTEIWTMKGLRGPIYKVRRKYPNLESGFDISKSIHPLGSVERDLGNESWLNSKGTLKLGNDLKALLLKGVFN